jgi:hypothetical protein
MKKQHQGVRSTKLKENTRAEDENIPGNTNATVDPSPPKKMRDKFKKNITTMKCTATKQDASQQCQAKATNTTWC